MTRFQLMLTLFISLLAPYVCWSFKYAVPATTGVPRLTQLRATDLQVETSYWLTDEGLSLEVLSTNRAAAAGASREPVGDGAFTGAPKWPPRTGLGRLWQRVVQSISQEDESEERPPPVLFVHGSYHGAWCWSEQYFDYFVAQGHACYAISLRGTSGTGMPPDDTSSTVYLSQHVSDVKTALRKMAEVERGAKPLLVSHSFGGIIAMALLEDKAVRDGLAGAVFLCSVPPSGNGPMTKRFVRRSPCKAVQIVRGFVFKQATSSLNICRQLFFDQSVRDESIIRYMRNFMADSRVGLDLADVSVNLPSLRMNTDGTAPWLTSKQSIDGVRGPERSNMKAKEYANTNAYDNASTNANGNDSAVANPLPVLVLGARDDYIVDEEGVKETAAYFGVEPVLIPDLYHDVMLGPKASLAAAAVIKWWNAQGEER